jgi:hypothetical protein
VSISGCAKDLQLNTESVRIAFGRMVEDGLLKRKGTGYVKYGDRTQQTQQQNTFDSQSQLIDMDEPDHQQQLRHIPSMPVPLFNSKRPLDANDNTRVRLSIIITIQYIVTWNT